MGSLEPILFLNYSDLSFTFNYDSEAYTCGPKEQKQWPPAVAYHGAKHLIDRELIRGGHINLLNDKNERARLQSAILLTQVPIENTPMEIEEAAVEEEFPDLKTLNPAGFKSDKVEMTRKEMFNRVKELGYKLRCTVSNIELKRLIDLGHVAVK